MQYIQLARHVPSTELRRNFSGPLLAKRAVTEAHLRCSSLNVCQPKNPFYLAATGVHNQTGCETRLVVSGLSDRPRYASVVALAHTRTLELEPIPLDEVSTISLSEMQSFTFFSKQSKLALDVSEIENLLRLGRYGNDRTLCFSLTVVMLLQLGDGYMAGLDCICDQLVSRVHATGRVDRILEAVSICMVCEERA